MATLPFEYGDVSMTILQYNNPHLTYLITYSQLDHHKFPTRQSFDGAVVQEFGGNHVDYFVVTKECHHENNRYHYHMSIKLNQSMRWKAVKT